MPVAVLVCAVALPPLIVLGVVFRRRLRRGLYHLHCWLVQPVESLSVIRKGHVVAGIIAIIAFGSFLMYVGLVGRQRNLEAARRIAHLESPTRGELLKKIDEAIHACSQSPTCPEKFVRVINRVVRVTPGGRIIATSGRQRSPGSTTEPPRVIIQRRTTVQRVPGKTVIVPPAAPAPAPPPPPPPPPPAPRPPPAPLSPPRLDSRLLDRVDNTVRALELQVGQLGQRVDRLDEGLQTVLASLCRSLLRLLCGPQR